VFHTTTRRGVGSAGRPSDGVVSGEVGSHARVRSGPTDQQPVRRSPATRQRERDRVDPPGRADELDTRRTCRSRRRRVRPVGRAHQPPECPVVVECGQGDEQSGRPDDPPAETQRVDRDGGRRSARAQRRPGEQRPRESRERHCRRHERRLRGESFARDTTPDCRRDDDDTTDTDDREQRHNRNPGDDRDDRGPDHTQGSDRRRPPPAVPLPADDRHHRQEAGDTPDQPGGTERTPDGQRGDDTVPENRGDRQRHREHDGPGEQRSPEELSAAESAGECQCWHRRQQEPDRVAERVSPCGVDHVGRPQRRRPRVGVRENQRRPHVGRHRLVDGEQSASQQTQQANFERDHPDSAESRRRQTDRRIGGGVVWWSHTAHLSP